MLYQVGEQVHLPMVAPYDVLPRFHQLKHDNPLPLIGFWHVGDIPSFIIGFLRILSQLPIEEPWPQPFRHGLVLIGSLVMTESIIRQSKRFRDHPPFTIVLIAKCLYACVPVSSSLFLSFAEDHEKPLTERTVCLSLGSFSLSTLQKPFGLRSLGSPPLG